MTQTTLKVLPISSGIEKSLDYIRKRREGLLKSLKTSFKKLNAAFLDGIDWNRIFTIAGRSGGGKSTILEQIKQDFLALNDVDFVILSFEFEMLIEDQIARTLSSKTEKTVKELYSATKPLSDSDMVKIEEAAKKVAHPNLFYVDTTGTVEQIKRTILEFVTSQRLLEKNMGLVVTIDHLLLTKGKDGEAEKAIVDELMYTLVDLKKYFASIGLRSIFICLSQLNRSIEDPDRVSSPMLQFPNRNDIFASSAVYTCSDYVMITHRPADLVGMGKAYGPKGWPVKNPHDNKKDMIYWHIIKERFGKPITLFLTENFEHSRIEEITLDR